MASIAVGQMRPSVDRRDLKLPRSSKQAASQNLGLNEEQFPDVVGGQDNYRSCSGILTVLSMQRALEELGSETGDTRDIVPNEDHFHDTNDSNQAKYTHINFQLPTPKSEWGESSELDSCPFTHSTASRSLKTCAKSDAPSARGGSEVSTTISPSKGNLNSSSQSSSTLQPNKHASSPKLSRRKTVKVSVGPHNLTPPRTTAPCSPNVSSGSLKSPGYVPGYHTARRAELRALMEKQRTENDDEDIARKPRSLDDIFCSKSSTDEADHAEIQTEVPKSPRKPLGLPIRGTKPRSDNKEVVSTKTMGSKSTEARSEKEQSKGSIYESDSEWKTESVDGTFERSPTSCHKELDNILRPENIIIEEESSEYGESVTKAMCPLSEEQDAPKDATQALENSPAMDSFPILQETPILTEQEIHVEEGSMLSKESNPQNLTLDHQIVNIENPRVAMAESNIAPANQPVPYGPWNVESCINTQGFKYSSPVGDCVALPIQHSMNNLFCVTLDPNFRGPYNPAATPLLGRHPSRRGWRRARQFIHRPSFHNNSIPFHVKPYFWPARDSLVSNKVLRLERGASELPNVLNPEAATYVPSVETRSKLPTTPDKFGSLRGRSNIADSLCPTGPKVTRPNKNFRISSHLKQGNIVILNTQSGQTFKSYFCPENKRVNCKLAGLEPNLFATTQTVDWDKFAHEVFGSGAKESINRVQNPGKDLMFLTRSGTCVHTTSYARALVNICVDYSGRRFAIIEFSD